MSPDPQKAHKNKSPCTDDSCPSEDGAPGGVAVHALPPMNGPAALWVALVAQSLTAALR